MKLELSLYIFKKLSDIKFHENPPRVNRVLFLCGQIDTHIDGRIDRKNMKKAIDAFCNFANARKNGVRFDGLLPQCCPLSKVAYCVTTLLLSVLFFL
jgi:hypothetical protein